VVCSTDRLYGERGAEVVAALRDAGARYVLLAGRADVPGVDDRLFAGVDALAVIESVYAAQEGSAQESSAQESSAQQISEEER
jgi:methylmalonyl-CoA mutase